MIKQFIKPFFILVLLANASFAQQSRYMPVPPPDNDRGRVNLPQLFGTNATGDVVVSSVPAYLWQHGCGPTALGMVVGYYDGKGFSDLVPGNAATQTTDVDNVIANTQHYDDYSLPIDYYPNLYADKSQNGGAHTSNCLADFMETSWSSRDNFYGWSWSNDIANSFNRYIPFINPDYQCQTGYKWYSNSDSWSFYKNEIDNNRPVVLLVDSDGNGGTDHFVTGIGYNSTSNTYAIYDTWDHNIHWYSWRAMSSAYKWGIFGYTYFRLKFSVTASADPANMGEVQGGGYYFTGEQVTFLATANQGYRFVNWTENSAEVSTSANYVFNAGSNRNLIAHFEEISPEILETLPIGNLTLNMGDIECYNATQYITVAGGGSEVEFLPGSAATLIAGNSIRFLPGFNALNGSTVSAYITTDQTFCPPLQPELFSPSLTGKSSEIITTGSASFHHQAPEKIKVYPNPCKNRFTVEYRSLSGKATLAIIDVSGKKIQSREISEANNKVEISNLNKGMYLIHLQDMKSTFTYRVVVTE